MNKAYNRGENHGRAKLTARQVLAIKNNQKASSRLLAIRYGISHTQVLRIQNNKNWIKTK